MATLFFGVALPLAIAGAQGSSERGLILPTFYPDKFDNTGHIDRLGKNVIVIDDSLYKLASFTEYATPTSRHTTIASFRVGNIVGYKANAKREIVSLWLLE
jgi:hypothetical protein